MTRSTRRALVLLAPVALAALVTTAVGAGAAHAAVEPGSGLQSLSLRAVSGGQQFSADTLAGTAPGSAAGGVPWAAADMGLSSAHALASVAWPGELPGNAGSLLLLLGPNPCVPGDDPVTHQPIPVVGGTCDEAAPIPQQVMDQYHYLNSPVRAEAQYPAHPEASQDAPGAAMEAAATGSTAAATAIVGGGYTSDGLRFGTSRSTSVLQVTGARSATSSGSSLLKDLSLAGGVLTARSVASHAEVTTQGDTATATGGTTISGLEVGGIPVSVDGSGIHVSGSAVPAAPALDAVRSLLANAGLQLYATAPTKQVSGGSATYRAGSLVVVWDVDQKGPKDDVVVVLGGAEASAAATLPYTVDLPLPSYQAPGTAGQLPGVTPGGLDGTPGLTGTGVPAPTAAGAPAPQAAGGPVLALAGLRLPRGWTPPLVVALSLLFAAAALLAAAAPARVLAATGSRCDWEEA